MAPKKQKEKQPRKASFMKKIINGNKAAQKASFLHRKPTLKKKAYELQTLCDVAVCLICFGPDGNVDTWPENPADVKNLIRSYKALAFNQKHELSLLGLLMEKKRKLEEKKNRVTKDKIHESSSSLSKIIDGLSEEDDLMRLEASLESTLMGIKNKIELSRVKEEKGKEISIVEEQDIQLSLIDPNHELMMNYGHGFGAAPGTVVPWSSNGMNAGSCSYAYSTGNGNGGINIDDGGNNLLPGVGAEFVFVGDNNNAFANHHDCFLDFINFEDFCPVRDWEDMDAWINFA